MEHLFTSKSFWRQTQINKFPILTGLWQPCSNLATNACETISDSYPSRQTKNQINQLKIQEKKTTKISPNMFIFKNLFKFLNFVAYSAWESHNDYLSYPRTVGSHIPLLLVYSQLFLAPHFSSYCILFCSKEKLPGDSLSGAEFFPVMRVWINPFLDLFCTSWH